MSDLDLSLDASEGTTDTPEGRDNLVGDRLRDIRRQQGLSLADVEAKSGGSWKAVVVGAYERGDRAVTISRLADLAEFYGVPLASLLPARSTISSGRATAEPDEAPTCAAAPPTPRIADASSSTSSGSTRPTPTTSIRSPCAPSPASPSTSNCDAATTTAGC